MRDHLEQLQDVFTRALEFSSTEEQSAYLDEACGGNSELRSEVESLLSVHQRAEGFLQPLIPQMQWTTTEETPKTIGPYKIREQLGEGGFGLVYAAEQTVPVRRMVALKVIKMGMDTKEVLTRFEAEKQALALMDHAHIAKVFDAGTTEAGRPYFVMELICGMPITQYCLEKKCTLREQLILFVDVCRAVQHAHQKGIIHRDLKPSNILITLHDGEPVVKVIDFGVAKALSQKLTEHTVYTRQSQMIGTPAYMSPEQAELSGLDIDTRSDVYSLGVLLYELLTGVTPFDQTALALKGFDEMRRVIREVDPPLPSHRVSTIDAEAFSTLRVERSLNNRQFSHLLKRELDWIVMKALEKNRERRYESANALTADVQRYLNDEPVAACPPSFRNLLRKYAKRHKVWLTTVAVMVATLLIATGVSVTFAVQTNRERQAADDARGDAEIEKGKAVAAKELAVQRLNQSRLDFDRAIKAIDTVVEQLSSQDFAQIPGVEQTRSKLLQKMLSLYEEIAEEHSDDPFALQQQALACGRIAEIHKLTGNKVDAEQAATRGVKIMEKLLEVAPDDRRCADVLSELLWLRSAIYGVSLQLRIEDAARALAIRERLSEPHDASHYHKLGLCHKRLAELLPDDSPAKLKHIEEAIRIPKAHGKLPASHTYTWLARYMHSIGNYTAAEENYRLALEVIRSLQQANGSDADQVMETYTCTKFAQFLHTQGRDEEAYAFHSRSISIAQENYAKFRGFAHYENVLIVCLQNYLNDTVTTQEKIQAARLFAEMLYRWPEIQELHKMRAESLSKDVACIPVLSNAIEQFPQQADYYLARGTLFYTLGEYDRSLADANSATKIDPSGAKSHELLAKSIYHQKDKEARLTSAIARFPEQGSYYHYRGAIYRDRGMADEAIADLLLALEFDQLGFQNWIQCDIGWTKGDSHFRKNEFAEAIEDYTAGLTHLPSVSILQRRGRAHFRLQHYEQALDDLNRALDLKPADTWTVVSISPSDVASCPDEEFKKKMRALADRAVQLNDRSSAALIARVTLLIALGELELALDDLTSLAKQKHRTCYTDYQVALLFLHFDQAEKYRDICQQMRQTFKDSDNPQETHFTSWTCALAPNALDEYEPAIKLARQAVEKADGNQQYLNGLGAILLRAGQYAEAKQQLESALEAAVNENTSPSYSRYFLAMTEHHLGNTATAQEELRTAHESTEKDLAESPSWNRKLTLELLRREAETLIGSVAQAPPAELPPPPLPEPNR